MLANSTYLSTYFTTENETMQTFNSKFLLMFSLFLSQLGLKRKEADWNFLFYFTTPNYYVCM